MISGPIVFTDLDDTLFQTERKCPADMGNKAVMSTLDDGSHSGFASERQQRATAWMRYGTIIPVTARSRRVLARVDIEQAPAICSNGGCILKDDGELDQEWERHLINQSLETIPVDDFYQAATTAIPAEEARHWTVRERDVDLYFVIKSNKDDATILDDLQEDLRQLAPPKWRIHRNGNNLAALPPWLNKRNAVAYLLETLRADDPHLPVIGVGDSHSDVGFMDLCDFAMTPTTSQVWGSVTEGNKWCS